MRQLRVIYVISSLCRGGAERQMVELLKCLSKNKFFKIGLVILDDNSSFQEIFNLNIEIFMIKRRAKVDFCIFKRLYKIFKYFKANIVHTWESMATLYTIPIAKMFGIKIINGDLRNAPNTVSIFSKPWIRNKLSFPFSDCIVTNSYAGLNSYNVPSSKGLCIHNGLNLNRFKNLKSQELIKESLNIQTSKIVGIVARFTERKDYSSFFESALYILDLYKDVTFLTLGDGDTLNYYKKKYINKGKGKIKFLGNVQRVEEIINVFDIGVLLTNSNIHGEGIPNSVMEYMALNKPVLVSDTGGVRELVINNITGFILPPFDIKSIVRHIIYLLNNPEVSKEFGNAGKLRIIENFSISKMNAEYSKLYYKLMNG